MKRAVLFALPLLATSVYAQGQITVTMKSGKSFVIALDSHSPKTVEHITNLTKRKFFDGIKFHRVEDWVVQWGDPNSRKTLEPGQVGNGGSGHSMPFEESKVPFKRGVVGIASTGAQLGGDSQIFVLIKDADYLNGKYAVLGKVTKGMDVIDKMKIGDTIKSMFYSGGKVQVIKKK